MAVGSETIKLTKLAAQAQAGDRYYIEIKEPQLDAMADEVQRRLREIGEKPARVEGTGQWILLDYSDLVVHIQSKELRSYYMLDRLWNDCPTIELDLK